MDYKQIKTQIIVRVVAIVLTFMLMFSLASNSAFPLTVVLVLVLAIAQVIALIKYIERIHIEIHKFFTSVQNNDFSEPDLSNVPESYQLYLKQQFSGVLNSLRKARHTREERQHYLTTIVQHVGIGLITFDEKGEIQIMNIAAKRLLKTDHTKNIEELRQISNHLVDSFYDLKTGGRVLIKLETEDEIRQLSVYAIELSMSGENFKLISLQNIQSELEENEMEAWQKLVRVLTHEIMNSVTPISSLATTVESDLVTYLDCGKDVCEIRQEDLSDIHLAVQTIQRRSEGLIRFVSDFRSLTQTPEPKFQFVEVALLLEQVRLLLKHEMETNKIKFEVNVNPDNLIVTMDPELIQQVLINLLKNAIQAFDEQEVKNIWMYAYQDEKNNYLIAVKDNGSGIDDEAQSKIFIPFFTTKKTGSGIGLSLSRQIMRKHNGSISVKSKVGEGTEFIMRFNSF